MFDSLFRCVTGAALPAVISLCFATPLTVLADTRAAPQFAVSGATSQPALADGLVELSVGTAVFTAVADAAGRFAVQAQCGEFSDELVYVVVRGVGAQSDMQLARVLDGCGRVQASADLSGGYRTGPINPISTGMFAAMQWLAEREAEYEWPMTASELNQIQYRLAGNQVARAAQAIAYWEAELQRPEGVTNSLELVLDRAVLSKYASAIEFGQPQWFLDDIARKVFWQATQFRRPSILGNAATVVTVCPEFETICGEKFDFNADGTLQFVNTFAASSGLWLDLSRQDQIFADALQQRFSTLRTLEVRPDSAPFLWVSERFRVLNHPDFGFIPAVERTSATRAAVRIVDASDVIQLLGVQYDTLVDYPDYPEIGVAEVVDAIPAQYSGIFDLDERPAWTGPTAGEQWILPVLLPDVSVTNSPLTSARIEFQADSIAVLPDIGQSVSWAFVDQVLTLSSADLGQQRLYFLGGAGGRHPIFFVDADPGPESSRRSESRAGFKPSLADSAWQTDQVAGRYIGGFALDSWLTIAPPGIPPLLVFDLNADGTGMADLLPAPDAPMQFGNAVTWAIDDQGALILQREITPKFRQWRRWERLTDVQNGVLYLRESTPLLTASEDPPDFADYRVNFYQVLPIPD